MFELSGLFKGVWADSLSRNIKKTSEITVAVLKRYQTWVLLIMAIDAYNTIASVLIHDFPGKTLFELVWLLAFGAAFIIITLSNELGDTAFRPALVDRGRCLRHPLRSATRFG
jgi:hypothetical protein